MIRVHTLSVLVELTVHEIHLSFCVKFGAMFFSYSLKIAQPTGGFVCMPTMLNQDSEHFGRVTDAFAQGEILL